MKKGLNLILGILLLFLLIIILYLYNPNSTTIKQLASVEVKEYNGEKLSSITDFRENSIKGPQYINISDYKLQISGLVDNPRDYTYEEVIRKQNYEKVVTLRCVEGWDATILWRGILVRELLDDVKPKEDAKIIIFHAYDGYSTEYPIDYFYNNDIIIAYMMNNVTIPPERGFPFMLVAEDKWGYKWIKWITNIELSDDVNYKGYWESRGYSEGGNLNESFFD